jgi:hypothetical protein
MAPLSPDLARLNLAPFGASETDVRRLTATQIDRYGWRERHPVAMTADDRGTKIKESVGGAVS